MKTWSLLLALIFCATCARAVEGTQERIDSIQATVRTAFVAKRFVAINDLAGQMRQQRSRLADGRWELPFVTGAVGWNLHPRDKAAWQARLAQIDDWIASTPRDSTPYLAKATVLVAYAWDARGGGWANTVDENDWRLFKERLVAAQQVLESSSAISKASPVWYETMQAVALGLSWPEPAYTSLFNEAVQREPTYYFFYFNAAQYFLPRWQGTPRDLAKFVDGAVNRTQTKEGQTLYARIYWSLLWAFKNQTFSPDRAKWPRMRQGFQDILRSYPDNWNANAFAFYACMAEDWPTYLQATKLMTHPEPRMWMFGLDIGSCSQRAIKSGTAQ
jgi:hypothetical protein